MNGLDKILAEIEKDAEAAARQITGEAQAAAKRLTDRAREEAASIEAEAAEEAELAYQRTVTRAQSAGEIAQKSALLREKQRIIDAVLRDAYVKIVGLSDEAYFDFLEKLLEKYARKSGGAVILSEKDKNRAPARFREAVAQKGLTLSGQTRQMDGGMILSYGDVEENCSIEALAESERDRLHDVVNSFLFG